MLFSNSVTFGQQMHNIGQFVGHIVTTEDSAGLWPIRRVDELLLIDKGGGVLL